MGVLDEVDRQSRQGRKLVAAFAALLALAAGALGFWWVRHDRVPRPARSPATFEEWDALLEKLVQLPADPADGRSLGRELDEIYYYPQLAGLKSLHAEFSCPFVLRLMRYWMEQNGYPPKAVEAAHINVIADWSAAAGLALRLDGWPDGLQPSEKQRQTDILRDVVELLVPPPNSVVLSLYDVTIRQTSWAVLVFGRGRAPEAPLDSFRKIYFKDGSYTYVEGAGPEATFQTVQRFERFEGRRVVAEQRYAVQTQNAGLRYSVTPVYHDFDGVVLPTRITQVYTDPQGGALAEALELESTKMEVGR